MISQLDNYLFNEISDFMNLINKGFPKQNDYPYTKIYESDHNFVFKFEIPGISSDKINIETENDILTLSFEKNIEDLKDTRVIRNEIHYGKFTRSFQLPVKVDAEKATAEYKNGILTVILPKSEEEKPKKISIKKE